MKRTWVLVLEVKPTALESAQAPAAWNEHCRRASIHCPSMIMREVKTQSTCKDKKRCVATPAAWEETDHTPISCCSEARGGSVLLHPPVALAPRSTAPPIHKVRTESPFPNTGKQPTHLHQLSSMFGQAGSVSSPDTALRTIAG